MDYVQVNYDSDEKVIAKLKQNKKCAVIRSLLLTVWIPIAIILGGVIWAVCTNKFGVLYLMIGFAVVILAIMIYGVVRGVGGVEYEITDRRIVAHTDGGYYQAAYGDIISMELKRSRLMKGKGDIVITCGMCGKRASLRHIDEPERVYAQIKEIKETPREE